MRKGHNEIVFKASGPQGKVPSYLQLHREEELDALAAQGLSLQVVCVKLVDKCNKKRV